MVAVVEQTLSHVESGNASALVLQAVEHKFVLANALDRQFVAVFQRFLDVVGIESCQRTYPLQVVTAEGHDVGERTHHHAEVAEEATDAAERFLTHLNLVVNHAVFIEFASDARIRQELLKTFTHTDRATTRAATTVRGRECFVQVDVHHVETDVARAAFTKHWVEVCAIVVHQTATVVHEFCDFGNIVFKQAQSVRVGHHHTCDGVVEQRFQVFHIHAAIGLALHFHHVESANCRTCRVGAVCAVGNDNLGALSVAAAFVIATNHHQAGEFTVCASEWIERELCHTSDF